MRRLEHIYGLTLIVIFGGIVLHAPLSVGFGVLLPDYALLIKSWKEILMLLLIPVAVIVAQRRALWPELQRDWVFRLIVAYAALHVVIVGLLYQGAAATAAGLAIDLRYVLFFGLVYVLIRARPDYRMKVIITAAIGATVVVGFGVLQLFLPADSLKYIGYSAETIAPYMTVDQNHDFIRINSTLRGPNPLGAYMVIVLSVTASLVLRHKDRLGSTSRRTALVAMAIGSVAVLWASYSRSALVAAVTAVVVVVMLVIRRRLSARHWVIMTVIVCALAGGLIAARQTAFVSNVLLHDNPTGSSSVSSNDEHVSSLVDSTNRLASQPFGVGVGSTGSASLQGDNGVIIENQYLFTAHETGWIGLTLFMGIFGLVMWRLFMQRSNWLSLALFGSGVGLALIGILLPVWVDDTVSLIWWGLAAVALAQRTRRV